MRATRLASLPVLLAVSAGTASAAAAPAPLPPGVDALVSATSPRPTATLLSPRLYTKNSHTLLLAFVIGAGAHERVSRLSGDGLRWSLVARSDGAAGAVEVWRARAKHRLSGRITARLASVAQPASIMVIAYGGTSPYLSRHAAGAGRSSTPSIGLRPTPGSLVWTVGLSRGQRKPVLVTSVAPARRVMLRTFDRRRGAGAWIETSTARSAAIARAAGASWARSWDLVSVDVVVPSLKRLIEAGLLSAFGAIRSGGRVAATLPRYCPPAPAFEVGVEDDPVFLGRQPAMSATRGFELAATTFHARLLRLNVMWGEVKKYGWAPFDRAVQMARERCWNVHLTIMWTPQYAESYLNNELSAQHLNSALLASFASEVATRYAGQVVRFAIGDEPDYPFFLAHGSSLAVDMANYDRMYLAGYNAVRAADPGAEVIAGEIGLLNIWEWLHNVAALPSSGVGIHPYFQTSKTSAFAKYIQPVPLLVSEDGVQASQPNQLTRDFEREEIARQAGVKEYVFYQLSRADSNEGFWWDTGIQ